MSSSLGDGFRMVLDDSLHGADSPKACGWIDRARAWVVIGFTMGTVSPGGDLYEIDPSTGNARLLWASADSSHTQAIAFTPPGTVHLTVFESNMDHPRDSTLVLPSAAVAAGP
jgi:hypothetical protein